MCGPGSWMSPTTPMDRTSPITKLPKVNMQHEATRIIRKHISNSHLLIDRPISNNYSNNITYNGVQELLQPITETVMEEEGMVMVVMMAVKWMMMVMTAA